MQAEIPIRQYRPAIPDRKIVPTVVAMPPTANAISSLPGDTYFNRYVQKKRLAQKMIMATMLYCCATGRLIFKFAIA